MRFWGAMTVVVAGMLWTEAAAQQSADKPDQAGAITQSVATPASQPQAGASDSQAPVVITLQDALQRARKLDPTYRAALADAGVAHEDHVQARAALLPGV